MIHRLLPKSRYLILLAVIGSFLCATVLLGYGAWESVVMVFETLTGHLAAKKLLLHAIETVDIFLLATVFYIVALGLYELFIDPNIQIPDWLEIRTLDDLKNKLLGVVVTVLGVLFLGQAVTWDGVTNLLPYGASVALVIAALTLYLRK